MLFRLTGVLFILTRVSCYVSVILFHFAHFGCLGVLFVLFISMVLLILFQWYCFVFQVLVPAKCASIHFLSQNMADFLLIYVRLEGSGDHFIVVLAITIQENWPDWRSSNGVTI